MRHLYIKSYSRTNEDSGKIPQNCGLFVAGVPFLAHDVSEVLTDLFGAFGTVDRVAIHSSQVRPELHICFKATIGTRDL